MQHKPQVGVRVNQVKVQHGDGNGGSGCIKETNPKLLVVKFYPIHHLSYCYYLMPFLMEELCMYV